MLGVVDLMVMLLAGNVTAATAGKTWLRV